MNRTDEWLIQQWEIVAQSNNATGMISLMEDSNVNTA